ncbi:ribonuclease H [Senna tora]|uniref:Ribonuclease H n=1 Tax=Senna tora TaxID=362788 RepID=A0A834WRC8_9FABA|nr:ribonuclease H [Senna tora]
MFDSNNDCIKALEGGPWVILDHYLTIRTWSRLFDPKTEKITKIATWVRLPELPIELYDEYFLSALGNQIEKMVKIDHNTELHARGKYARICVEIDLGKPLLCQYVVHGSLRNIEYEGIHNVCFECGTYGHDIENCPITKAREDPKDKQKEREEAEKEIENEGKDPRSHEGVNNYGNWIYAQKTRRNRRNKPKGNTNESIQREYMPSQNQIMVDTKSRFAVLEDIEEESNGGSTEPDSMEDKQNEDKESQGKMVLFKQGTQTRTEARTEQHNPGIIFKAQGGETNQKRIQPQTRKILGVKPQGTKVFKNDRYVTQGTLVKVSGVAPNVVRYGDEDELRQWLEAEIHKVAEPDGDPPDNLEGKPKQNEKRDMPSKEMGEVKKPPDKGGDQMQCTTDTTEDGSMNFQEESADGDFNEIKSVNEQKGGARPNPSKCAKFTEWIDDCNLIEVETEGPRFSWIGGKREGLERCLKKLDHVFCTPSWRTLFEEATAKLLVRLHSDHHPIFIKTEDYDIPINKPFKFKACWLRHQDFGTLIKESWKEEEQANTMLTKLTPVLLQWNKNIFGNIFKRKKRLISIIEGIQRVANHCENRFLYKLENDLKNELDEVLKQEEILWFQKSRGQWIHDGDKNTRLYHTKTIIRRRRNKVKALKDDEGDWVEDPDKIKEMAISFFTKLFHDENVDRGEIAQITNWPNMDEGDLLDAKVSQFVHNNEWRFDILEDLLPNEIIARIGGCMPPSPDDGSDKLRWKGSKDGHCTTNQAYCFLKKESSDGFRTLWKNIWGTDLQQRLKMLLWKIAHENLPTRKKLSAQGLGSELCLLCNKYSESILHIFRDCKISHDIWDRCLHDDDKALFFSCSTKEWVRWNIQGRRRDFAAIPWLIVFATACSCVWQWRNQVIFNDDFHIPENPTEFIMAHADKYWLASNSYCINPNRFSVPFNLKWEPPPLGWLKINTDGSASESLGLAGCGGIIRDNKGLWMGGFHSFIGSCSSLDAELWGILRGMMLVKKKELKYVILECDSKDAFELMHKAKYSGFTCNRLIGRIVKLSSELTNLKISHVFRGSNICADWLAKFSLSRRLGVAELTTPPRGLISLIACDRISSLDGSAWPV